MHLECLCMILVSLFVNIVACYLFIKIKRGGHCCFVIVIVILDAIEIL